MRVVVEMPRQMEVCRVCAVVNGSEVQNGASVVDGPDGWSVFFAGKLARLCPGRPDFTVAAQPAKCRVGRERDRVSPIASGADGGGRRLRCPICCAGIDNRRLVAAASVGLVHGVGDFSR